MPMVDDLPERFRKHVECSTHVDVAVAWATKTSALDQLMNAVEESGVSLRIIVGTHGNATDPDVLDRLNDIRKGELRLVPHSGPLFHPKVYIFRGEKDSIALIGSANFTNGGFGENVEAVFETKQLRSIRKWFKNQWKQYGKLSVNENQKSRNKEIEEYRERRRRKPPSRAFTEMMGKPMRDPRSRLKYLDQAQDWSGYVKALKRCQRWWKDRQTGLTVYGETRSWTHAIEQVGDLAKMSDWDGLNDDEIRQLLPIPNRDNDGNLNFGLLGTTRPKAGKIFLEDMDFRHRFKDAVTSVVNARPTEFPDVAVRAANDIMERQYIGIGVATRILALARPDMVVSLNGASREGLVQIFPGIDRLKRSGDYGKFLGRLYEEPWFDSEEPNDVFEQKLWSMRAALLDCFVYSA